MAYNYIDEKQLADALHESEEYMADFHKPIPELQRVTRGKPGKVPEGKPNVTDGTLAGIRRELPKQIIQQLPTGKAIVKQDKEAEGVITATLTDSILPYANSGGTPFSKAKRAIKNTVDVGSSWAEVFMNRTGSIIHADYRLKYYKDVLFEKGKTSEFDNHFMPVVDWMTETDIKALIWQEEWLADQAKGRGEKYEGEWNVPALKKLVNNGPAEKDDDYKNEAEKKTGTSVGYFKIVKFYQIGVGATFFKYAPAIKQVVGKCVSKDPRGIIPVHGLVPEEDEESPLGEPLAAISAPKQNLMDFDMQMYQYGQGLQYSPPVKQWGNTPSGRIKLIPDQIIKMKGTKQTDDFEVVNIANNAINNYSNNYGLLKTQIQAEMGRRNDSSVSSTAGNPGFSKTSAGVKQSQAVTDVSNNDLTKTYELWQGRVWETCLNMHFAHNYGIKPMDDFEDATLERLKLDETPMIDFDKDRGPIKFTIDASTSQADDNDSENEKLTGLLDIKQKYGMEPDDKFMKMYNQIVKNSGVDDPEKLMYTEDEIEFATQTADIQRKQAMDALLNPQPVQPALPTGEAVPTTDDGTMPIEGEIVDQPPVDPIEADREAGRQQLLAMGLSEDEAEAVLQRLDQEPAA